MNTLDGACVFFSHSLSLARTSVYTFLTMNKLLSFARTEYTYKHMFGPGCEPHNEEVDGCAGRRFFTAKNTIHQVFLASGLSPPFPLLFPKFLYTPDTVVVPGLNIYH